jgi:hypothetical protein
VITRTDFLHLVAGRGNVLEPFLNRVYGEPEVRRVVFVSPWLSHLTFRTGGTEQLLRQLAAQRAWLTVITRTPQKDGEEHRQFVHDVLALRSAEVFLLDDLHAKFYWCQTSKRAYALLGSANMYRWTANTYEIGVTIDARGEGEILLSSLRDLAMELRQARSARHIKGGSGHGYNAF